MLLLVDNYDSFTCNLAQLFENHGVSPELVHNDENRLLDMAAHPELKAVCISSGGGLPEKAGFCLRFLSLLPEGIPVLGIGLGHQILGSFAGAALKENFRIMHGKQSQIRHNNLNLFKGLPLPMSVARYHSLILDAKTCPGQLEITASTPEGEIMALAYKDRPWAGVQFHPESVLTPEGGRLIANFLVQSGLKPEKHPVLTEKSELLPLKMPDVVELLAAGKSLNEETARHTFNRLMDGELSPAMAGAILLGLRAKGETSTELQMAAEAVLERAVHLPGLNEIEEPLIDIVGTGGDSKFSFNCSTAAALTLAGLGYKVLKHGNRSVSSRCGSADVLERLGISLNLSPKEVAKTLKRDNFAFLFAVNMHPAFRHIMPVRRELGVRTLFNMLGPLTNPGRPTHRLVGVARQDMLKLIADALAGLGTERGAVVYGCGGYDELTPLGPADIIFIDGEKMRQASVDPADFGFSRCTERDLIISGPDEGCAVLQKLLSGNAPRPIQEMVAMNVGLGIYLLEPELTLAESMRRGLEAVKNAAGRRFVHAQ